MRLSLVNIIIFLVILELVLSNPQPKVGKKRNAKTTKKKKGHKSTSSSESQAESDTGGDSLDLTTSQSSSSSSREKSGKKDKYRPRSTEERTGWRKWHRQCTPCPEDMRKKWRDPSIAWLCGGYQRARRSFKSNCMMRYRNCQDGTMFIKIHGGRCKNDSANALRKHGDHFLYDYKAVLSDDSSNSESSSSSSSDDDWKKNWHLD